MVALLEQPEQLALLQARPELIDNAADEMVRWTSPVKHFARTCRKPITVSDTEFQPGDLLYLSYASANRDDEVFPTPTAWT
jgi:cytochrome P450